MDAPRSAVPERKVLMSQVSCLPVSRSSLPVPYWEMCSAWVLLSFSMASLMACVGGCGGLGGCFGVCMDGKYVLLLLYVGVWMFMDVYGCVWMCLDVYSGGVEV